MKVIRLVAALSSVLLFTDTSVARAGEMSQRASTGGVASANHLLAIAYPDSKKTSVDMIGTTLDRRATGSAEIEFEHGRSSVKLAMHGLGHPQSLGTFYTTFILWAVAPEGQASNIAELPVTDAFSIKGTTPFQTFALIVTAEPHSAVKLPGPAIVAENVLRKGSAGVLGTSRLEYRVSESLDLSGTGTKGDFRTPLPILGAQRAVEMARQADADHFAYLELREAETKLASLEQLWPRHGNQRRYEEQFSGMAHAVMRLAEQARALALERSAQASLRAEREVAQTTLAQARAETASAQADSDSSHEALKQAREEAQDAHARVERTRTEAEKAKANEEFARADADQARLQTERARLQAERAIRDKEEVARQNSEITEQNEKLTREKDALQQRLQASLSEILDTRRATRGLIVTLSDVYFDVDSSVLKSGAREKLDKLAGILGGYAGYYRIEIEGHTDSTGSDGYNLTLSQERAESVRACLQQAGVPRDRILATRGLGKAGPVASNETAAGRQLNRRVELVIEDMTPSVDE